MGNMKSDFGLGYLMISGYSGEGKIHMQLREICYEDINWIEIGQDRIR
jgi:hypothetical protein